MKSSTITPGSQTMVYYITSLLAALSIFSIAYYVANAFVIERTSTSRAAFGLANVATLALYASYLYFDTKLTLNSPNKIVDQVAFLFAALFFLYAG